MDLKRRSIPFLSLSLLIQFCEGVTINILPYLVEDTSTNISCSVPNFDKNVYFYHPRGTPVGVCKVGEDCKSDIDNYFLMKDLDKNEVIFEIRKLEKQVDSGFWICSYGTNASKQELLRVYDLPAELPAIMYVAAVRGQELTLYCNIHRHSYQINWYFSHQIIRPVGRYIVSESRYSTLNIDAVDENDTGLYHCAATFPETDRIIMNGTLHHVNVVNLRSKESQSERKPASYIIAVAGKSLTLLCDIYRRDQRNSVNWYFNEDILKTSQTDVKYKIINGSLKILSVTPSNSGYFYCSVEQEKKARYGPYIRVNVVVSMTGQKQGVAHWKFNLVLGLLIFVSIAAFVLGIVCCLCRKRLKGLFSNLNNCCSKQKKKKPEEIGITDNMGIEVTDGNPAPVVQDYETVPLRPGNVTISKGPSNSEPITAEETVMPLIHLSRVVRADTGEE